MDVGFIGSVSQYEWQKLDSIRNFEYRTKQASDTFLYICTST